MPESKSKFLIPAAIGAAVLVAGGVATYFYLKGTPGDVGSPLASAKVVPDEAIMAAFISVEDRTWEQLQKFGTPEAQKLIGKNIKEFQDEMLKETNFSFEKDLKPWVGSVMFAVLPSGAAANPEAAQEPAPNLLVVVGIKDKINALNFAQKIKSQKSAQTKETDYKGVKVADVSESPGKSYSIAVLNNHLVLSDQRKTVEMAIDTFKGEPSFAGREGASTILTQGLDLKNPIAQLYLPDYAAAVQQLTTIGPNPTQLPPTTLNQLKQVKSAVLGMGVDDSGLRFKVVTRLDPKAATIEYKPVPGKVISQFPADTIVLLGGQGIKTIWTTVVEQGKTDPSVESAVNLIRQQLKAINLDADKEVFGWMDGEFALGAIPSSKGMLAQTGFGGALVIQTSDRKTAEATLTKLDTLAKNYTINVAQRDVQGKPVTEWKMTPTEALIGHGWIDQNSLFLAIGGPIVDVIATKPANPLDSSENYKTVNSSLPKSSIGYFYLNMNQVMALLNSPPFKAQTASMPPEASAFLNSIQGIGMAATQPDKLTSEVEVFMALKSTTAK